MSSEYGLCTMISGSANLVRLDAMTTPLPDPQDSLTFYAERTRKGSGVVKVQGAQRTEWRYPLLTANQLAEFLAICPTADSAWVYFRTCKLNGQFGVFLALMEWPEKVPLPQSYFYYDITFAYSMMMEVGT